MQCPQWPLTLLDKKDGICQEIFTIRFRLSIISDMYMYRQNKPSVMSLFVSAYISALNVLRRLFTKLILERIRIAERNFAPLGCVCGGGESSGMCLVAIAC